MYVDLAPGARIQLLRSTVLDIKCEDLAWLYRGLKLLVASAESLGAITGGLAPEMRVRKASQPRFSRSVQPCPPRLPQGCSCHSRVSGEEWCVRAHLRPVVLYPLPAVRVSVRAHPLCAAGPALDRGELTGAASREACKLAASQGTDRHNALVPCAALQDLIISCTADLASQAVPQPCQTVPPTVVNVASNDVGHGLERSWQHGSALAAAADAPCGCSVAAGFPGCTAGAADDGRADLCTVANHPAPDPECDRERQQVAQRRRVRHLKRHE
jgi:hypothetical protein